MSTVRRSLELVAAPRDLRPLAPGAILARPGSVPGAALNVSAGRGGWPWP